ncbi:amidohydrolase family protein [Galbibacter sp. EGI 63066]|uniref:amidohydrolase family protein n=1 Tax=Galbibacter sp. EGI 63066 TaxID=2993559 RepID=UPI0022494477|nr:amidohydrolase family protein [Galbibacter sp. EGI 63066]MCX2679762.1 amidohydrolase family protein [Galbibacter sp. EGI 63066]
MIDTHQHFWEFDPVRDAWIDDSMQAIRRDFLPSDLEPVLKKNNVDGCIAVQADQSEKETQFLLDLAKKHSFIKGVVGWVDLLSSSVEERLTHFSKDKNLKGIRHIVQAEADDFMLRSDFQHGISKLKQFKLTYDILVFQQQLPAAIKLAEKFPDQAFVLDHIAKPKISEGVDNNWKNNIEELAKNGNVYCKLSGMVTETEGFKWKADDFKPFLDVVVNTFGVDRIMFGSDWPVCLLSCSYEEVLKIIKDYIPKEHQPKVFHQNAVEFYSL